MQLRSFPICLQHEATGHSSCSRVLPPPPPRFRPSFQSFVWRFQSLLWRPLSFAWLDRSWIGRRPHPEKSPKPLWADATILVVVAKLRIVRPIIRAKHPRCPSAPSPRQESTLSYPSCSSSYPTAEGAQFRAWIRQEPTPRCRCWIWRVLSSLQSRKLVCECAVDSNSIREAQEIT